MVPGLPDLLLLDVMVVEEKLLLLVCIWRRRWANSRVRG
jgi:hypothetical protein